MPASDLHTALLKPAVIQVLKASGFGQARPGVLDALTDLTARYLLLLASETVQNAMITHGDAQPTVQDVRVALDKVGALQPQMRANEEAARPNEYVDGISVPFEDLRGVQNLIEWIRSPTNQNIRRVGGLVSGETDNVADLAAGMDENEDYVTAVKKKHSKTAEESRYQGTMLGKDSDLQPVTIAGGSYNSLSQWRASRHRAVEQSTQNASTPSSTISSALSTPIDSATPEPS